MDSTLASSGTPASSRKRKHPSSFPESRPTREYGFMRDAGGRDTTRFVGSSSGIHFVRSVYVRLARKKQQPQQPADLVPGEDDQVRPGVGDGAETSLWRPDEVVDGGSLDGDDSTSTQPSFEQLAAWSRSYFESWHPVYPFLHAPDVLDVLETVSQQGGWATIGALDRAIVRTVMSISLADRRQSSSLSPESGSPPQRQPPLPRALVFDTVAAAVAGAQFALCQPASIPATQAALSIQLFLLSLLRLNSASRLGGLIVRMAFHLGLHRCPARYPFFSAREAALRRRIFWSLYSIERFLCQSLGLPLDIRDDDVDVCYPGEEQHGAIEQAEQAEQAGERAGEKEDSTRLQLLAHVAKHARIRGLILELRNKSIASRHDNTADVATHVHAELARWCNEIQDAVEGDGDGDGDGDDDILGDGTDGPSTSSRHPLAPGHCVFLLLLKYESLIALSRPVMTSDASSASYAAALHSCISAAKSIFITLRRHRPLPVLWPSFTWSVWISAFILIYATSEKHLPLASALRHVESGKAALSRMAARGTAWPTYCLAAIDELTAAVRELSRTTTAAAMPPPSDDGLEGHHSVPAAAENGWARMQSGQAGQQSLLSLPNPNSTNPTHQLSSLSSLNPVNPLNPSPMNTLNPPPAAIPIQDQESLLWYDQLFANTLGAVESPFLAAAQFDSSVDPTWSYLR